MNVPLRPLDRERAPAEGRNARPGVIAAVIGLLIAVSAAAGFLVTTLGPAGGIEAAARSVVALTTTLENGKMVTGTGVILTATGEVVTGYDVVNGAVSIAAVVSSTGSRYAATTFGLDPTDSVAVLQLLDAKGLPSASVGTTSDVAVGDQVTAIGGMSGGSGVATQSPATILGLGQTAESSAPDGTASGMLDGLIAFNAPLPVNGAGGPLVDASGKVVGIDVAVGDVAQQPSGKGFAIPIDRVMTIVHDVNSHTPSHDILQGQGAYLGIEVQESTTPPGATVVIVQPGTPAAVAGMAGGDIIVSIDGVGVDSVVALREQLQRYRGGQYVTVAWLDPQHHHHAATVQLAAATFA